MHRDIRSQSIASIVRGLPPQLINVMQATAIAVAMTSLSSPAQANAMEQTILPEEAPGGMVSDQGVSVGAFGYLAGLSEARFDQPHSTTDDPRDEIQQASSFYDVDLAMIMSIAKVESDFVREKGAFDIWSWRLDRQSLHRAAVEIAEIRFRSLQDRALGQQLLLDKIDRACR